MARRLVESGIKDGAESGAAEFAWDISLTL